MRVNQALLICFKIYSWAKQNHLKNQLVRTKVLPTNNTTKSLCYKNKRVCENLFINMIWLRCKTSLANWLIKTKGLYRLIVQIIKDKTDLSLLWTRLMILIYHLLLRWSNPEKRRSSNNTSQCRVSTSDDDEIWLIDHIYHNQFIQ